MPRHTFAIAILLSCFFVSSCGEVRFYSQAIQGQLELLSRAKRIERVIQDPRTPNDIRQKLAATQRMRAFAKQHLGQKVGRQYTRYADLGRDSAVYVVYATPELSLKPKTWCYPVAGCVAYRGFFAEADAKRYAAQLRQQGYDVFDGGVDAYSTLGFFPDPLLNTFMDRSETQLAELIFHELSHVTLYVGGDTAFNESFANTVQEEGTKRWLQAHIQQGLMPPSALTKYQQRLEAFALFRGIVAEGREALTTMYQSALSPQQKRQGKQQIFARMRTRYHQLKPQMHGLSFDGWFGDDLNNAQMNTVSLYDQNVAAFKIILQQEGHNLPRFYERVRALGRLSYAERNRILTALRR